jgi:hypothetical protein
MFMPETKGKTLEELDQVFSVPTRFHAGWGLRQITYVVRRYLFRQKHLKPEVLYEREDNGGGGGLGEDQVGYRELGLI